MRIGALRAGYVEVELQSGESLRSFLESLAAIVVGRSGGIFASCAEIILRNICQASCLPWRGAGTQYFVQALKRLASVAIGVDANPVTKLSSQQTINGHTEPLTEDVPKRSFYTTDSVIDNARYRTCARSCKL